MTKKAIISLLVLVNTWVMANVSVTFQVDMREQTVSQFGVHIAGSQTVDWLYFGYDVATGDTLPAWNPGAIALVDTTFDGIYEVTMMCDENTTYEYKFVNGDAWGYDETSLGGNRSFTTGTTDTTVVSPCFDSLDPCSGAAPERTLVTFQIDMKEQVVSANGVHIAGSQTVDWLYFGFDPSTGDTLPAWDPAAIELFDDGTNGDLFADDNVYSVAFDVTPAIGYEFKYVNGNEWGADESSNRPMTVGPVAGVVLPQVCFNSDEDCPDFLGGDTLASLTFSTSVARAIANGGFELGDTLLVIYGYGGTQVDQVTDTLTNSIGNLYSVTVNDIEYDALSGLFYQYYRVKNSVNYRETYFNFDYEGAEASLAERRFHDLADAVNGGDLTIEDNVSSNVDARRQPVFRNTDALGQEVTVTYTVDIRPAYYQVMAGTTLVDIQGTYNVTDPDSVFSWGVWINGPATPGNWVTWGGTLAGTAEQQMHDDGVTGGDAVAGDSVYSVQFTYDATDLVGQEFKFGIHGGDNESGYGLNHIENIDVDNPVVESYWGSINPVFYSAWDYDTNTPNMGIEPITGQVPGFFSLSENYPNPFNPTTNFEFTVPFATKVKVSIYNILGESVATLQNSYAKPGTYSVTWNGRDKNGIVVPSGMYFYEIDAGSAFHQVKKMTLLK